MNEMLHQLRRSLAMRGAFGTLQMCAVNVMDKLNPAARKIEMARQQADAEFDERWNVDTGGIFRPGETEVHGVNWVYGIRYQAVDANALNDTLQALPVVHEDFTFVDFGSGKGRAVLVASAFPFRKIIGVEYCEELNRIAKENLLKHSANARRCDQIEIIHTDAAHFVLPDGPLVMFFYNPFGRPVMESVVNNVCGSFRANPRRMVVIYFTPYEAELWTDTKLFERIQETPAVFDNSTALSGICEKSHNL